MNKIENNKLGEIKIMQIKPKLYLANYFSDLKSKVDLHFFGIDQERKIQYILYFGSIYIDPKTLEYTQWFK